MNQLRARRRTLKSVHKKHRRQNDFTSFRWDVNQIYNQIFFPLLLCTIYVIEVKNGKLNQQMYCKTFFGAISEL